MMDLGGLPRIGAAAVAADPCILAEALVRLYNEEESVAIAHKNIPSCSERRFRHLLQSLETAVPHDTDLIGNFKLERSAYLLTGAPREGWSIKAPY